MGLAHQLGRKGECMKSSRKERLSFPKLNGRWGGYGLPSKMRVVGRRMIRRVGKLLLKKDPEEL